MELRRAQLAATKRDLEGSRWKHRRCEVLQREGKMVVLKSQYSSVLAEKITPRDRKKRNGDVQRFEGSGRMSE